MRFGTSLAFSTVALLAACVTTEPPAGETTASAQSYAARLNQTVGRRIQLTPLEIIEDSRCPRDVQCIQAGTVRLRVRAQMAGQASEPVLKLGESQPFGETWLTLAAACPDRLSTEPVTRSDYRFTFTIGHGPPVGAPPYEDCSRELGLLVSPVSAYPQPIR